MYAMDRNIVKRESLKISIKLFILSVKRITDFFYIILLFIHVFKIFFLIALYL